MDTIWFHDPNGRQGFLPCALTDRSANMRSKTLWEIDQLRKADRRQRASHRRNSSKGRSISMRGSRQLSGG